MNLHEKIYSLLPKHVIVLAEKSLLSLHPLKCLHYSLIETSHRIPEDFSATTFSYKLPRHPTTTAVCYLGKSRNNRSDVTAKNSEKHCAGVKGIIPNEHSYIQMMGKFTSFTCWVVFFF